MFRLFFWRSLCLLALIGGVFQLIGFFLPYNLTVDTTTHTTFDSDSYWMPFAQSIAGTSFYPLSMAFSLFALVSILFPLITALVELFSKPRRLSVLRLSSLTLAIFGFIEFAFLVLSSGLASSLCVGNPCVLESSSGSGLWPLCAGFLLSMGCFLTLVILGLLGWRHDLPVYGERKSQPS